MELSMVNTHEEWVELYKKLIFWEIELENIELDGNCNDFIMGGNWPINLDKNKSDRQIENVLYGVFICECKFVNCKNLNIHHFLNGIYLTDLWENIPIAKATKYNFSKYIYISNCRLSSNIQNNFCFVPFTHRLHCFFAAINKII